MDLVSCLSNIQFSGYKSNYGVSKTKSQHRIEEYFEPNEEIKNDPVGWFESLSPAFRETLSINAHLESKFKYNYTSQKTKGNMTNLSRETINRAENYFKSVGVARITPCGFTSNTFKISDWFRKNNLVFGISKIIPAFFGICMLLPKPIVTQGYYNEDIYKKYYNTIAASALERNHSQTQNQGNTANRTLSRFENNINTHKREIANPLNSKINFNSRDLLRKIAIKLRCNIDEIERLNLISLQAIIKNNPDLLQSS